MWLSVSTQLARELPIPPIAFDRVTWIISHTLKDTQPAALAYTTKESLGRRGTKNSTRCNKPGETARLWMVPLLTLLV